MDKPKLLLVDDESASLSLYSEVLKDSGAELIFYTAPEKALEFAKENECALLLVDIQMPAMDGFTLVEQIKRTLLNRSTPVIFLTAFFKDHDSVNKGYEHGAVDFLFKPVDANLLRSKVSVFLDLYKQKKVLADKTDRLQNELEEHKATRIRLLDKEKQLEMAQELTRIGNWRWDLIENKFIWDSNMFKLHGLSDNASAPQHDEYLNTFVHPDDVPFIQNFYNAKENLIKENSYKFQYRIINSKGKIIYLQAISIKVYLENRTKPACLMGTVQDITEQKKTEQELLRKKELLSLAVAASDLIVYEYDINTGMFTFSEEIVKIMPLSSSSLSFDQIARYFKIEQWQKLKESFELCINGRKIICDTEFSLDTSQGKQYFINRGKVVRQDNSKKYKILGAFINVTSLRVAQQQLSQINADLENRIQQELQKQQKQQTLLFQKSKLESLGELAAGIGHEINHPLSIIHMSVDNVLANVNNTGNFKFVKKKLSSIQDNIYKIADIIDQIHVFSREKKPEEKIKININEIIDNVTSLIQIQYINHNISLEKKLDENLPAVLGIKGKFEQVLFNLLSNARYAVEKRKALSSDSDYNKRIVITTFEKNDYIYMEFWDNGCGIEKEIMDKVFDPFFTTKEFGVGTGLGLSMVYGTIKEFHGQIKLESEPGKFTRFLIKFPKSK